MNLYLRFFDNETLVENADQALNFLNSLPDVQVTPEMEEDVREYADSDVLYPKRYKVKPRVYFIIIKTEAKTMLDFKQKKALRSTLDASGTAKETNMAIQRLNQEMPGWYEGTIDFKRVVVRTATGKCEYRDTRFVARCKATSGIDCYNRIVEYLRGCVDKRSQFPAAKGKNFKFQYLGMWK